MGFKTQIFNNLIVDNIYCLYLEEKPERKKKVIEEFKKKNLNVEMFAGHYIPNEPHTGCKKGHINIIKDAKEKKYKNILIFEDDIKINYNFPININTPKFDMFYLGYWDFDRCSVPDPKTKDFCLDTEFNLIRLFYCRSTYAYIINERIYNSILSAEPYNENNHYYNHIDMFYANYIQPKKKYYVYSLYPFIVSTIDDIKAITECAEYSLKNNKKDAISFFSLLNGENEFHYHRKNSSEFSPNKYNKI